MFSSLSSVSTADGSAFILVADALRITEKPYTYSKPRCYVSASRNLIILCHSYAGLILFVGLFMWSMVDAIRNSLPLYLGLSEWKLSQRGGATSTGPSYHWAPLLLLSQEVMEQPQLATRCHWLRHHLPWSLDLKPNEVSDHSRWRLCEMPHFSMKLRTMQCSKKKSQCTTFS